MSDLPEFDQPTLTGLARRALGRDALDLINWQIHPLYGGSEGSSRLYRVAGEGTDRGESIPWSLILKCVQSDTSRTDPGHWNYWKRELLAYRSGLLDDLPGKLIAPQCFDVVEQGDDRAWLWLEEISSEVSTPWPQETYSLAAQHLGRFNGAYLAGQPLPREPWLEPDWLRSYVNDYAPLIAQLPLLRESPLIRWVFPDATVTHLLQLYDERDGLLDALDGLPHTLCHRDAFPRNLFIRPGTDGSEHLAAIDWAFVGVGPIGQELAPLVVASVLFNDIAPTIAGRLEDHILSQYSEGLRATGVELDPQAVQFGYAASAALNYGLGCTGWILSLAVGESQHAWWDELTREPIDTTSDTGGPLANWDIVWHCADTARHLLRIL
jgi:hypothetical protein